MLCKHCYLDAGAKVNDELSTKEGIDLINEIKKAGFKILIFSGGEPLMRDDIYDLVAHASSVGLRPVFGTNGSLITQEVALKLKNLGVMGMGISLDSLDPNKHDKLRVFPSAYEKAIEGMKNCLAQGLPFQIHTTVMDWNKDEILNITDFAISKGARAHHIFFLVPTGRAIDIETESLRAREYENLITKIMNKQKEVSIEIKPTCAPQFMRIGKELGLDLKFQKGCLAGTSYCIISPKGDVQPCAYLNMPLGNVRDIPFSQIWADNPVFRELRTLKYEGKCGKCRYKLDCGGCRARAAFYNDGNYMGDEPWCLYQNKIIKEGNK